MLNCHTTITMGYAKDQIIQELEEEREYLEQVLDDIEAYGEEHTW